jgi:hypothetical protein
LAKWDPARVREELALLVSRGLDRVLGDLAGMGYDATWGVLGAFRQEPRIAGNGSGSWATPTANDAKSREPAVSGISGKGSWWLSEPGLIEWLMGVPIGVDRTAARKYASSGRAALAWRILNNGKNLKLCQDK